MIERIAVVASRVGLHARPAALFSQAAAQAAVPVVLTAASGRSVNAASILGVIALGVEQGDYVTLTADGDGAEATLDTLAELLTTDHDAE